MSSKADKVKANMNVELVYCFSTSPVIQIASVLDLQLGYCSWLEKLQLMPCLNSSKNLAKLALLSLQSVSLYSEPAIHPLPGLYGNDYQCFQQEKIQSTKTCCLHQAAFHQERNLADYENHAILLTISIDINLSWQQWQFKFLSIMQACIHIGVLPEKKTRTLDYQMDYKYHMYLKFTLPKS